ncbi:leader peptidase (prepilin peptidase)/N-methyltransferase [Neisseria bacilliformis ATCC BAA-1200]|uniref:Leader peptidase (Prepilin peptidase)/N-methyltransferase n=1 Tax=Neisseria bacilliformis ATCC BAA-1200 TaxID=888742 RepID=F2BD90_9NEIS|nr:leader peptidase (prepilin peptidase)/N-methyltransferase [Neisseria bacilliformis ATCC BAA-1200]
MRCSSAKSRFSLRRPSAKMARLAASVSMCGLSPAVGAQYGLLCGGDG